MRRRILSPLIAFLLASIGLGVLERSDLRWNRSPSLPIGLYRLERRIAAPGDLVAFCLTRPWAELARRRGYISSGLCPDGNAPVGKHLLARSGAIVAPVHSGVAVNGRLWPGSTPKRHDFKLRPLTPYLAGPLRLRPGQLWVMGEGFWSWDSRYFGPIASTQVLGVLRPVFVLANRSTR